MDGDNSSYDAYSDHLFKMVSIKIQSEDTILF